VETVPAPLDEPDNRGDGWENPPHACPLTRCQCQIARLVARGLTNSQIAATLEIPSWTVVTELYALMERLGLQNRVQVVVWVLDHWRSRSQHC
jgi:DNA-binding NarL/FixJ family response regulator